MKNHQKPSEINSPDYAPKQDVGQLGLLAGPCRQIKSEFYFLFVCLFTLTANGFVLCAQAGLD